MIVQFKTGPANISSQIFQKIPIYIFTVLQYPKRNQYLCSVSTQSSLIVFNNDITFQIAYGMYTMQYE